MADETVDQTVVDAGTDANAGGADAAAREGQARDAGGKFAGKEAAADKAPAPGAETEADWRGRFAAGDDKRLAKLNRFSSEADFMKSWESAQDKIAKGGHLPKPPADDAPDDVKAEWRKTIGVPDKPDAYTVPKIPGFEFGEGDQPLLASVREAMHAGGAPQGAFEQVVKWYADTIAGAQEAQREETDAARLNFEDVLGNEWGPEYRTNVVLSERWFDSLPSEVGGKLKAAAENDPDLYRWAASQARNEGYIARNIQRGGGDPKVAVKERMAEIEAMMSDPKSDYWKNPKIQEEFVELGDRAAKMNRAA